MNEKILRLSGDIQEILDREELTREERNMINEFTTMISELWIEQREH